MNLNEIKIQKSLILDGVEIKSATFIDKTFPLHFHHNWSLAYTEFGNENISFGDADFMLNKNAITLIPPYSIHRHWGNKNNAWSYKAVYLNNDIIKSIAKKLNIDYSYLTSFPYFISYINKEMEINESSILNIIGNLFIEVLNEKNSYINSEKNNQSRIDDVLNYLSYNYNKPITLEKLEKKFRINKFYLQRTFKKKIGLSPSEYLTAIRIENSKQLFYTTSPLVDIALESGFYDQSHFTNCFVKYVGVTPGAYKRNVKILQDQKYCCN